MGLRNAEPAFVYFLRPVGAAGPTKIGCTKHLDLRLTQAMIWSPLPLTMLGYVAGTLVTEQRLHARFKHLHLHSEWFREDAELDAAIGAILVGDFDFETLPRPWRPKTTRKDPRRAIDGIDDGDEPRRASRSSRACHSHHDQGQRQ